MIYFTIVAKNYFGYAKAWSKSVKKIYGEVPIYIFIADEFDGKINPNNEEVTVIQCYDIGIQNYEYMKFIYEVTEFATSVKPFCISWLFNQHPNETIIYMDADTMLISKFHEIEVALKSGAELLLTPHICEPLHDGKKPDEYDFIRTGIYNLGFGVFKDTPEVRNLVQWWERKLIEDCTWDLDNGIHVDQKWMDYGPAFVENTKIIRHPGYNLAYWNLAQRHVTKKEDKFFVNGLPLRFVHVSGNSLKDAINVSRHQNRFDRTNIGDFAEIFDIYHNNVIESGQLETGTWSYSYQSGKYFENIPFYFRKSFRKIFPLVSVKGKNIEKFAWEFFNAKSQEGLECGTEITNAEVIYYKIREDLRCIFDLRTREGQINYIEWLKNEKIDLLHIPGER